MAQVLGKDFIAGCMVYWGEGDKSKNVCGLANSDPDMIRFFVCWLRKFFDVPDAKFSVRVNVYLGNGMSIYKIEDYWLEVTGLSRNNLTKSVINHFPTSSSGKKAGRLPFGTCLIRVSDTSVVQKVFGAIKEYVGIEDDRWLGGESIAMEREI